MLFWLFLAVICFATGLWPLGCLFVFFMLMACN